MTDANTNKKGSKIDSAGAALDDLFEGIARQVMFIDTLATQRSDSLDFHNVAVWQVREALRLAYEAGRKSR